MLECITGWNSRSNRFFVCRACQGRRTRRATTPEWDAVSPGAPFRKLHPRLQPQNGTQFPDEPPCGKCVPESVSRTGRSFQMSPHVESPSRNEPSKRDTLSETRPVGKLYPSLSGDSGTQFPADAETENASRYRCLERDALSQWMLMRKLCPGIRLKSGMRFPVESRLGNGVPFA